MNGCVPDWDMEDTPIPSSSGFSRPVDKKPAMLDDELVELLWRDGQVVMQSQTQRSSRKSPVNFPGEDGVLPGSPEKLISDHHEEIGSAKNHLFIQEDEMASWLHYPLDHSFDREFCTDLFSSIPSSSPGNFCGGRNQQNPAERRTDLTPPIRGKDKVVAAEVPANRDKTAPENSRASTAIRRHFSLPTMSKRGTLVGAAAAEVTDNATRESRVDSNETPAMGSGTHGSFLPDSKLSGMGWPGISASAADDVSAIVGDVETIQEGVSTGCVSSCMLTEMGAHTCDTIDAMVTSSSGGSACSGERNVAAAAAAAAVPAKAEDRKRKAREADESECQSEDIEFESTGPKKVSQQSTSARRTRAAEVHNLSERRRRDRINEKMKALQELIPRSNKADKASMLDEAIEYLKSLQLQVQMMSMGCSMPPMMFPGIQHYMSTMGMGMGMGMGMEMPGAVSRPNFPFPQVVHNSAMPALVPPHFGPRIPMPGFHRPPNSQTDQSQVQATNRPDPALNLVSLQNLTSMQRPNFVDPYQGFLGLHQMHFPPQNQVSAQPSTSKGAEDPPDHKSG